jgi:hypothetical protein
MLFTVGGGSPSRSPVVAGSPLSGLLLVVAVPAVSERGRSSEVLSLETLRPSVVEEAARGRLETADGVGGRYDVGSGALKPCGPWSLWAESRRCWSRRRWVTVPIARRCGSPLSGLLLVVAVPAVSERGRSREVLRSSNSRPLRPSVVEEAVRGRLETADGVGGRYDVCSGGLEPAGRGWSLWAESGRCWSRSARVTVPITRRCRAHRRPGYSLGSRPRSRSGSSVEFPLSVGRSCRDHRLSRWLRRQSAAVSKPPMVWVVGTTSAAAGAGLAVVGGRRGRSRGEASHGRRRVTVHIARRCRLARRRGCSWW